MKKMFIWCSIILVHMNAAPSARKTELNANIDETETIVKKSAHQFLKQYQVPGMAMVLYVHNKPYFFQFGYSDKIKKTPLTKDTVFEIGSISKCFTTLLLAQEILEGTMKLNDLISEHIPHLASNKKFNDIQLMNLATHTATLPYDPPIHLKTEKDLITHLMTWTSPHKTHKWWQYSNHGIELIRIALEKITNHTFHDLVLIRILKPLKMSEIGIALPEKYKPLCCKGYTKTGEETNHYWNHPFYQGTGSIRASSTDMLQFLKAAMGLPDTPSRIKKAMQLAQAPFFKIDNNSYQGLGWNSKTDFQAKSYNAYAQIPAQILPKEQQKFNGDALIYKTGTTQSFHSYIGVIPNKKVGIVVMINRMLWSGFAKLRNFSNEVLFKTAHIA